jgi:DNA replication protein DnaC
MSGSSGKRSKGRVGAEVLRLDDQVCPHCGRELQAEWDEFPPALQKKYGKPGEWYYHPCTPECEKKNERREWELMRRNARVAALKGRSGLSKRTKNYTFGNFDPYANPPQTMRAAERVESYLKTWEKNREDGRGLYLCGDVGTGKTHLAVAVMNELMRKQVPALFVTVPGRDLDEWMETVKTADLLVLDDLGAEKPTAWVQERIFVIVNHRYREALPTIFTSNIGPKDLAAQLGERTASRIVAMTEGIELEGDDYREADVRRSL